MQPRPKRRAIVVGGSIAGLFTAAFLRRIGWQVEVYERSSIELIGRGVGIFATHLELFERWTNAVPVPSTLASLSTSASRSTAEVM
jgi:2-polyprenyl-6-methoxyphenol hydroxylase-like FAD-dependent oxidoreductase